MTKKNKEDNEIVDKETKLKNFMRELNKKYEDTNGNKIEVINYATNLEPKLKQKFGIKPIDDFIAGVQLGTFTTIYGSKGSGKTTLAYHLVAEAQKENKIVMWIALETFDTQRALMAGVNLEKLIISRFPIAEQALDSIIQVAREQLVDIVVLDSLHSLSPKLENFHNTKEKSVEDDSMALLARKLSQFFRMCNDAIYRANIGVLLIGQTRVDLGGFIPIQTLSGGNALKHYSRLIVQMRRGNKSDAPTEKVKNEEGQNETKIIGFDCVMKIEFTQVSDTKPEHSELHLPFYFSTGFIQGE